MRERRNLVVLGAVTAVLLVAQQPSANFQILAHDAGDPAPRKVEAALNFGLVAVSVLVTWTAQRFTPRS